MDGADFSSLDEGCITHILSLTSPLDVCRTSSVSSAFQSAAESDSIWERFLPSDYSDILSRSVSPLHFSSKKDLYFRLCQPLLIDDGKKSFWLEKSSGKKCYMVSARDLSISWGDDGRYWRWLTASTRSHLQTYLGLNLRLIYLPNHASVFSEVAELISVWWFDLRGTIDMAHLSPDTNYTVRFIVRHTSDHAGWQNMPVKLSLHVKSNPYMHIRDVLMSPDQAESVLQPSAENNGWMEVEVGEFLCDRDGGEVEFRMYELYSYKEGILVMGVEIRPSKMHCVERIQGILGSEQIAAV
ncbi:putative F-box protein PP2-B12 [Magnolia sinica]|uniref:putative F-box protein PP2-B12 n=1 Tax=Magnolia sinica TaxID=86752 RepID=UPI00265A7D48|nr:putative F-box protein PP2-B12 [Magnolia sinica]